MAYQQDYRIVGEAARLMADQAARNNGLSSLLAGYGLGKDIRDRSDQTQFRKKMAAAYNPQTGQFDARRGVGAAMEYDPAIGLRMMQEARLQEQQDALSRMMGGMYSDPGGGAQGAAPDDPEPLRIRGERLLQLGVQTGNPAYVNAGKADIERYQAETAPVDIPLSDGSKRMVPKWQARRLLGSGGGGGGGGGYNAMPRQGGAGPTVGVPTPDDVTGYLVGKYGIAPYHAAAITGNLVQESNLNPRAVGDGGTAYGMGQWREDRRINLQRYAQQTGRSPDDWQTQADYLMWEMKQGPERGAGERFFKTRNLQEATQALSDSYFRPGTPVMENRLNQAQDAYRSAGMSGPGGPGGVRPGVSPSPDVLAGRTVAAQEEARAPYDVRMKEYQAGLDREKAAYQAGLDYAQKSRLAQEQAAIDYEQKSRLAQEQQPREIGGQMEGQWIKETYAPVLREAQAAPKMRQQLDTLEQLNNQGLTGPGASLIDAGRRFFIGMGVNTQAAADKNATLASLQGIALQAANDLLLQANGVQTEGDVERAVATFPSLEKTKEANQFLIDYRRASLNQVERQARFFSENRERFGATPSRMTQAWLESPEGKASIWDDPAMARWKGKTPDRGEQRARQQAAGGQPAEPRQGLTPEQARAELERRRAARQSAPARTGATGTW